MGADALLSGVFEYLSGLIKNPWSTTSGGTESIILESQSRNRLR